MRVDIVGHQCNHARMRAENETLTVQLARLEERMNTMQAEYKTDIARLAEDMARRDTEAYKRETVRAWATIGTMIAVVSLATAIILAVD